MLITCFFILNLFITGFALKMFFTRLVNDYDLKLQNVDRYRQTYTELYNNPSIKNVVDKFFSYEKMLRTEASSSSNELMNLIDKLFLKIYFMWY